MRDRVARGALLATLVALAACDGASGITFLAGPSSTAGAGGGANADVHDAALVGRWSRTVTFTTDTGIQSSQTIWEFRADGSATRTVIATNHTAGISDQVAVNAVWRTTGSMITIDFTSPDSGTVQFAFGVSGSTLTLGGDTFTRIG
jgi:hypothetical protein